MENLEINDEILTKIKDRVVLITGGASGIGRSTAQLCLNLGATVVVGDLSPPSTEFENTEKLLFVQVNVTEWESLRTMFDQVAKLYGRIDHVFANAGIKPTTDFLDVTLDSSGQLQPPDFKTIEVNLLGPIYTTRLAAAYMSELADQRPQAPGGSIVLSASASSFQNFSAGDYTIAKHGVLGMIRGMGSGLQQKLNIRLNAVAPSWTDTGIVPGKILEAFGTKVQSPDVVARSVVLLFADQARHGEVIYSWEGNYREINRAGGGLLAAAETMLPNAANEESVMIKVNEAKYYHE